MGKNRREKIYKIMTKDPWYKDGISFSCQGCGGCCFGFPGYVWLSANDVKKIANFLKITQKQFLKQYTRKVNGCLSLKELKAPLYECIFLKDRKCSIYKNRPIQCLSYPFWPQNLESEEIWNEHVKKNCLGLNCKSSKHYSYEEIKKIVKTFEKDFS